MINNNWIFGNNCGLDFSTNPPTPTSNNLINTFEGCASISDENGNLLFYTDGQKIWDAGNVEKVNGLEGDPSSSQSSIIVPDPANSDQYYVLTTDGAFDTQPYHHFNGGLYNVVTGSFKKLSTLMSMPDVVDFYPSEKLTAVQHANCKDFWVITILKRGNIKGGDGTFRVFKIDSGGIKHHIDITMDIEVHDGGYLRSSKDLQHIAIASGGNNTVLLYPFDNSAGKIIIKDLKLIRAKERVYGVEFSPDSRLLYYGSLTDYWKSSQDYIYQVDFKNSLTAMKVGTIKNQGGHYAAGALQLGIDDRIYISKSGEDSLAAIENPNNLGTACNMNNSFIKLAKGSKCILGLPNLLPNACKDDSDCGCGCTGCNEDAEEQNEELIERAKEKFNTVQSDKNCPEPFTGKCELNVMEKGIDLSPCFSFHWGDSKKDQIEEHDTEVFYLTVCNNFNDITYKGLKITKVILTPNIHPLEKIQIVPDRLISLDCLKACTCQTREFAMITRAKDTAGDYTLEVEYCYEEIAIASNNNSGLAKFPIAITKD